MSSFGVSSFEGRVFNIGLNKTGTGSLHLALQVLGIPSAHYVVPEGNVKDIIKANAQGGRPLLAGLEQYRAISDWNFPDTNDLFRDFDEQYPGSKFIMTTRSLESWLRSRESHVSSNQVKPQYKRDWKTVDVEAWTAEYHHHHQAVREYFANRPGDLLEMDISQGDGWEKLCPFLGVEVPSVPFPHKNKAPNLVQRTKEKAVAGWHRVKPD